MGYVAPDLGEPMSDEKMDATEPQAERREERPPERGGSFLPGAPPIGGSGTPGGGGGGGGGGMPGWLPYALGGVVLAGLVVGAVAAVPRLLGTSGPPAPTREPDVILLVMDTVRSDHTHVCGHDKPNTPTLDRLKGEGWQVRCDTLSPAPWTVPSHISFFTGGTYVDVRPMSDADGDTLAEQMAAKGYDTAFLSANMVLRKSPVFTKGFRTTFTAKNFNMLKGPRFPMALERVLDETDPNKPLFLFLNLVDAHAPYPAIPKGVDWAKPQRGIQHRRFEDDTDTSPFNRFMTGKMSPDEAAKYKIQLDNGYDYGIYMADQNVGAILDLLKARVRLDHYRMVITADHGELLGEHSVIGHGDTLYEPGMRVPFLYMDTTEPAPLPEKNLFGVQAFYLLRDGTLGEVPTPPYATNYQAQSELSSNGVAMWGEDGSKLVWKDGESFRFDLSADPGEENPQPIGDHPLKAQFEAVVEKNHAVIELESGPMADDVRELLEAAGYLAPDDE